jgi:molybdopterin molybdotransferase
MLRYEEARQMVISQAEVRRVSAPVVSIPVSDALGFVLAEEIRTDRAYPPFDRSTRDGYAARASEAGAGKTIRCVGEIKAGDSVTELLAPATCVQIMTGAAIPAGADAVVMIEHTKRDGDEVRFERAAVTGQILSLAE